jgi:hypothetical protein
MYVGSVRIRRICHSTACHKLLLTTHRNKIGNRMNIADTYVFQSEKLLESGMSLGKVTLQYNKRVPLASQLFLAVTISSEREES